MSIQGTLLQYAAPLTTGLLVAGIIFLLWPEETMLQRAASGGRGSGKRSTGIFLALFGWLVAVIAPFMSLVPMGEYRARLQRKLIQAGSPGALNADEFNAARIISAVLLFFCGSFIDSELGMSPVAAFGLAALGMFYPDIWLTDRINWRRRRIFRDLPDFLDTLRLGVDAGLDLSSALKVAVEKGRKGPLLDEMEKVERDIALGRTRKEGFRAFADRLAMSEINAFVLALIQADQLGASIGPILKIQADVARTKRWQLAEVLVNKLPMKMLGPLIIFIFPASFIILFTPLVIQWFQSGE